MPLNAETLSGHVERLVELLRRGVPEAELALVLRKVERDGLNPHAALALARERLLTPEDREELIECLDVYRLALDSEPAAEPAPALGRVAVGEQADDRRRRHRRQQTKGGGSAFSIYD